MNKEIIIITGGASGLGLELVKQSIARGLFVCNIDWNQSKMKELEKNYEENYKGFVGDISDESFIKNTITEISKIGNIKYLVNNAGEPSFKLPCDYSKEDIDKCFKGLQGMIIVSTEALNVKEEKDLKIVNVMSSAALRGNKQEAVYCATKWGEKGYTESLKVAYKGTSVKIIGVYPGGINTDFYKNSRDYVSEEKQNSFMNPKDVADTILNNILSTANLTVADIIIERNS
ncbi:MAG: SDR family NAD(P)-dependent oxidoreductase [Bacilli bacterium]|nr:SDR family NAD(P)-dependent oxidoreductase [Bacilli bacterium]